jgi:TPR repeat protein
MTPNIIYNAVCGDASAHWQIAIEYLTGEGLLPKDIDRGTYWLEKAALGGHVQARMVLGLDVEMDETNVIYLEDWKCRN